ncbi:MAG: hypothetical protein HQL50_13785 [Magnetococcales bacterium]|nr:hypothetical protein [Magnetococcales bacterium]
MKVNRFWFKKDLLVPQQSEVGAQDGRSPKQRLRELRRDIMAMLTRERFVSFKKQPHFYFDNQLNCLWLFYDFKSSPDEMFQNVKRLRIYAFKNWEIPPVEMLQSITFEQLFNTNRKFQGSTVLSGTESTSEPGYRTVTMGYGATGVSNNSHTIIPMHAVAQRDIFAFILAHSLVPDVEGVEEKLKSLYHLTTQLSKDPSQEKQASGEVSTTPQVSLRALQQHLLEGDYVRARLPVLEPAYLYDMGKGLWELHQPKPPKGNGWVEVVLDKPWEARNPEADVRDGVVAIDFGTSSTVVAYREHGKTTLLRVGMNDFYQIPIPEDYQNPTVLTFVNLPNLMAAWNSEPYRPLTRWEDFHFSHEALAQYRENEADRRIVASILTTIKQWPLNASDDQALRITDQMTGTEMDIRPVRTPMPTAGEPLTVSEDDPLDPIELYAYYLGLFINHRANGVFLEYHMTFPITYPRQVKKQILASFARGLQRSLPPSIIDSSVMQRFAVREEASEPAAYAACALGELEIEATEDGAAYAVFDFGGGTTDFDFGIYRLPSEDEEDQGYEKVIKHFGASGDMFLGGENLVAHLAYQVFQQNLDVCRTHHIPFSCPTDAEHFPGHEMFIDNSHVAQTNSALLTGKVRPIWEAFNWEIDQAILDAGSSDDSERKRRLSDVIGDALSAVITDETFTVDSSVQSCSEENGKDSIRVELLNRDRKKISVLFKIDHNKLNHFLVRRVGNGVLRFFIAMNQAFESHGYDPDEVHILQAGNSSRSMLVQSLFAAILQEQMVGWRPPVQEMADNPIMASIRRHIGYPRYVVHRPPPGDPNNPYKPTAKTGVAIGLLKLIPGETLLAISPNDEVDVGEAPFRFFVGKLKKGAFQPVLHQNGAYNEWRELGIPTRGVFNMVFSTSPQSGLGTLKRGSSELLEKSLRFYQGVGNRRLFIRAIGPSKVEVHLAHSQEQIFKQPEMTAHREVIDLAG